jgi:geranylgeranyl diphosphate synthase type II
VTSAPRFPDRLAALVDGYLDELATGNGASDRSAFDRAWTYPLEAGGKRLRPVLVLATVEALGGDPRQALPTAAALEWIHTFSLVHDDLPAMDDDVLRRGRPTTHVAFGEDVAVLVGDMLLTGAIRLVAERQRGPATRRLAALAALAEGCEDMIRGQYLDVRPPEAPDEAWLARMCALKSGSLIRAAVAAGLALAAADDDVSRAYVAFAEELGLGFQIVDDLLDATGSDESLGKPAGSDAAHGKRTFVTVLGLERARALATASEARCGRLLEDLPGATASIRGIAARVYGRTS